MRTFSTIIISFIFTFLYFSVISQTVWRDPTTSTVNGAGNNWSNVGAGNGVNTSNDVYSTVATAGSTSQLRSNNYGFTLLPTDIVVGIEGRVERSGTLGADVSLMGTWMDGENSALNAFPLAAGNNRMLIVFVGVENAGFDPIVSGITYGGRPLTLATGFSLTTPFWARTECWYLPESQLITLPVGNHNIVVSYGAFTKSEFFDIVSAAIFQNVDQVSPFQTYVQNSVINGGATSTLGTPIVSGNGGLQLTSIFCGANTTPGMTNGGTNTFTINSSFTEGTDRYRANAGFGASGGCMQTAFLVTPTGASTAPTFTFAGTPNRRLMIGIGLRKTTSFDNGVRLLKAGVEVGNNLSNAIPWPLVDTYVTYGGPTNMWGTSWNFSEVNANGFGLSLAANVINGSARVDNMQLRIYTTSVLPVELLDFDVQCNESDGTLLKWITASEINSDRFEIYHSEDGINFEKIAEIDAAGNSTDLINYEFLDTETRRGFNYYKLRTVDKDASFSESDIRNCQSESKSQLYPNPTSNWFTLETEGKKGMTYILDLNGKIIDEIDPNQKDQDIHYNISDYPDGSYYIIYVNETNREIYQLKKISSEK